MRASFTFNQSTLTGVTKCNSTTPAPSRLETTCRTKWLPQVSRQFRQILIGMAWLTSTTSQSGWESLAVHSSWHRLTWSWLSTTSSATLSKWRCRGSASSLLMLSPQNLWMRARLSLRASLTSSSKKRFLSRLPRGTSMMMSFLIS